MTTAVTIRQMEVRDLDAISTLLPTLGYHADVQDLQRRFDRLSQWPDQSLLVAVADLAVVGMCQAQGVPLIASEGYAEIAALVVALGSQSHGIGSMLLQASIDWARGQGYARLRLRSGVHRDEAHGFYEHLGFSRSRASYAFECVPQVMNNA